MTVKAAVKLSQDELKKAAAYKAVEYVQSGMKLGLGTGSTAAFAVDRIGDLLASGELKDIIAVPTSIRTYEQAKGTPSPFICFLCRTESFSVPSIKCIRCETVKASEALIE